MARTSKSSPEYWKEREVEHAKTMLTDDKKVARRISFLYRDAAREIEKEINNLLGNYGDRNELTIAEVMKRVNETDIRDFEAKAAKYVKEKDFSDIANREMAIYNLKMRVSRLELIVMHIDLELTAATDGAEKLIYERLIQVGEGELLRQAGILGEGLMLESVSVDYIARRQFHNDDFSNRLWKRKRAMHFELEKRLTENIIRGENPRVTARKFRKEVASSVFNSERLLITETARVQTEVQKESFVKSGFSEYEFIATEGACDICLPLDGQIFKVSEMMPGTNSAPMHPFCKCSTAAHMSREEWDQRLKERGL
jgi:SPP1 gp7 family putative phage head morphogenesis protein